jgi:Transposase
MSRTRYTDKEKARIMRDFDHNDQSTPAFCLLLGVSYQTFMNWRRRAASIAPIPKPSPTFVEFEFGAAFSTRAPIGGHVELESIFNIAKINSFVMNWLIFRKALHVRRLFDLTI